MSLRLAVDQLRRVSTDVWEARLSADDLSMLNSPDLREGNTSILFIKNPTAVADNRLEFRADYARVLNLGESKHTIVVVTTDQNSEAEDTSQPESDNIFPTPSPFDSEDC